MDNCNIKLETKNAYSEVLELLKHISKEKLMRIPANILKTMEENRNDEYFPEIKFDEINNSISLKAKELYVGLYLKYIVESEDEKARINKILYENEIKIQSNLKLDENMFKSEDLNEKNRNDNIMIEYKPNVFKRMLNKIKKFLKG